MASKSISIWCAGLFAASGVLWLAGQPSSAAEEPVATGQKTQSPQVLPKAPPEMIPAPAGAANSLPQATSPQSEPAAYVDDDSADSCGAVLCGPPERFWLRADYLMWWTNGMRLPPLVTSGSPNDPPSQAGALGNPNTTILYGDSTVGNDMRSGVRVTLGKWLDRCHVWSIEFDYLTLGERARGFSQTSGGDTVLARPYYNVERFGNGSELVAYPGLVQGTVEVDAGSYFQSAGALLGRNLCSSNSCNECDPSEELGGQACGFPLLYGCRTDLLVGFRHYNLGDHVDITEDRTDTNTGTADVIHDVFHARNEFYGSELGLRSQFYRGRWSLGVLTKIAMGNTHQTVTINGQTLETPLGGLAQTFDAGRFAVGTNSGVYQRDLLTLIPQLSLQLGYQVNCRWRAYIGYDVLYWGAVSRAGDQIDLFVDPRGFPPTGQAILPFPQPTGKMSAFWAQGISLGTELRF